MATDWLCVTYCIAESLSETTVILFLNFLCQILARGCCGNKEN